MACEQFAAAGMPVDEARFRIAVTRMARLPRTAVGRDQDPLRAAGAELLDHVEDPHSSS